MSILDDDCGPRRCRVDYVTQRCCGRRFFVWVEGESRSETRGGVERMRRGGEVRWKVQVHDAGRMSSCTAVARSAVMLARPSERSVAIAFTTVHQPLSRGGAPNHRTPSLHDIIASHNLASNPCLLPPKKTPSDTFRVLPTLDEGTQARLCTASYTLANIPT